MKQKGLLISIIIKLLLFGFFAWQQSLLTDLQTRGNLLRVYDDTEDYFLPTELLLEGKGYSRLGFPEYDEPEYLPFAGRMPGMLPLYAPLYLIFGKSSAADVIVVLQLLLSTLSVYVLGLIAWRLFHAKMAFLCYHCGICPWLPCTYL